MPETSFVFFVFAALMGMAAAMVNAVDRSAVLG
jgi:hypothetical protein